MQPALVEFACPEPQSACAASLALEAAEQLFRPYLLHSPIERLVVAGFDCRLRLVAFGETAGGQSGVSGLSRLTRHMLGNGDVSVLVVGHNHPAGIAKPSLADREATRRLGALCRLADVQLAGHLLFAGDDCILFHAS